MSYHLFLDDDRHPQDVKWIELPPYAWVEVKSYAEFVKTVKEKGIPETVSFDHDLADEHYAEYRAAHDETSPSFGKIRYENLVEKTGMDCARFLAELCVKRNVPIPRYYIHTLNGIGLQNIASILESARKVLTESK